MDSGDLCLKKTIQTRIFKLCEGFEKNDNVARSLLQDRAVEKSIKLGNIMDLSELPNLFKFSEANSSCLFIEPPLQWYELIIRAAVDEIKSCTKITLQTKNINGAARFKEVLTSVLAKQWQKTSEVHKPPAKQRAKKRSHPSNSIPPSPTPQPPSQSAIA